jgi:DNA-binding IclR family transcriptional regulator
MSEVERLALYKRTAVPSPTGEAETDPVALSQASVRAFADRLAVQVNGTNMGVACVASPILDETGKCGATISIVLSSVRSGLPELRNAVSQAALTIAKRIGYDRTALRSLR